MNPINQFGPSQQFENAQNSATTVYGVFIVLFVVVLICGIAAGIQRQMNYNQAKQDFLQDPNNVNNKVRLVEAASQMSTSRQPGSLDAIAMMEATRDPGVNKGVAHQDLVSELQRLANLHANGHLTDIEFEKAKAKLLN